jgi:hypothetical protein
VHPASPGPDEGTLDPERRRRAEERHARRPRPDGRASKLHHVVAASGDLGEHGNERHARDGAHDLVDPVGMRAQHRPVELFVRPGQIDLDRGDLRTALQRARQAHVLLERASADRHDDPHAAPTEARELPRHERVQPRVLETGVPDDAG